VIQLQNISLSYRRADGSSQVALAGVDLEIGEGQFVCLLGPSGCGKTSLLNLVAGFLRPEDGCVRFNGTPVKGPGPDRGVVFQDATLFPWLTVRQNVEFGLRRAGCPRERMASQVAEAVMTVGLAGHEYAYPHALSGGMRQRAAIARVLVMDPSALLMDEPFSALDANARERLQDELLRIWERHRRTVLYVTHSVEEAAYLADRVLIMGPPPRSVVHDVVLSLPRPRDRQSAELREATRLLRGKLDGLPCCVGCCPQTKNQRSPEA
jgi:NitT/TauT family transport system ATP-binding protein